MALSPPYNTLILDWGDVLFTWSSQTKTSISPKTLKAILSSDTWANYERGRLIEKSCYTRIATEFSVDAGEVATAVAQARTSLKSNDEMIAFVRALKDEMGEQLRVYALSNISAPDYEYLRCLPADWSIFDGLFPSGHIGERKPDLGAYRHVIAQTGTDPRAAIFVDDKLVNVMAARAMGMHGIVFDKQQDVMHELREIFQGPDQRGRRFLYKHAGTLELESVTDGGLPCVENFSQLLILEQTRDGNLVNLTPSDFTWNFFRGKPLFYDKFPNDLDTTSLALTVVKADAAHVSAVMDEMLNWRNKDGIFMTYFDTAKPRTDLVGNVNVLSFFYSNGRGDELPAPLAWVRDSLVRREHLEGSRYYPYPDTVLYFTSRLLSISDDASLQPLRSIVMECLRERTGLPGDALELSLRILSCSSLGIADYMDVKALLAQQREDGGWDLGWLYCYDSTGVKIGNTGLTTAMAIKAIESVTKLPEEVSNGITSKSATSLGPLYSIGKQFVGIPKMARVPVPN